MKKILVSALFAVLAFSAGAQDMYWAELLGKNSYYGTARSIALGNAMTALGGDPGSYVLNPAGSAVCDYGQVSITPGLIVSSTSSSYLPYGTDVESITKEHRTNAILPNVNGSVTMNTGREYGLIRFTFGFQVTGTSNYHRPIVASGTNSASSFLGSIAESSFGQDPENFSGFRYASFHANQFGQFGHNGKFAGSNQVIDSKDTYAYVPSTLNQRAAYSVEGTKQDVLFNFGFDINDVVFLGFNIGFPTVRYGRYETFYESSVDPSRFPVTFNESILKKTTTYYLNSTNQYRLSASASGIYGKIGVLWLPVDGLRVGAAFRSPTSLTVSESWQYTADCAFESSRFDSHAYTTPGEYSYIIRTPYSANVGVAYTFFDKALVSLDYELEDFSSMRYRSRSAGSSLAGNWYGVNETNRLFCGLAHNIRVGAELKLTQEFALRAGYCLATSPERTYTGSDGQTVYAEDYLDSNGNPKTMTLSNPRYVNANNWSASLGFGYSSPGSFYVDLAARMNRNATVYYSPYYNLDYKPLDSNGKQLAAGLPLITAKHTLWDVVLTLGWRF